jgi:hypothetical protein
MAGDSGIAEFIPCDAKKIAEIFGQKPHAGAARQRARVVSTQNIFSDWE